MLGDSQINTVNLSEVIGKLSDISIPENEINQIIEDLNIETINFDDELAYKAGNLKKSTNEFGLSLGDRACIATAIAITCNSML